MSGRGSSKRSRQLSLGKAVSVLDEGYAKALARYEERRAAPRPQRVVKMPTFSIQKDKEIGDA